MTDIAFLAALAGSFALIFSWAFRHLPRERWQMVASVPLQHDGCGGWHGLNLTWYGIFTANAYVVAVALMLALLASVRVPAFWTLGVIAATLSVCVPASRLVARVVEKKKHTFTVAGAVFVGTLLAPVTVGLVNRVAATSPPPVPLLPALAAMAVSVLFGESLGRLACLSFGCCYGRPLREAPAFVRRLCRGFALTFRGHTKKAAYEGNLEGEPLIPVQALTAVVLAAGGLAGAAMFLRGWHTAALLGSCVLSQGWRLVSEFLRADHRGEQKAGLSRYQLMAPAAVLYCAILCALVPRDDVASAAASADLGAGVAVLWDPAVLLFLQGLWVALFLYTGRSRVTASRVAFHVVKERI